MLAAITSCKKEVVQPDEPIPTKAKVGSSFVYELSEIDSNGKIIQVAPINITMLLAADNATVGGRNGVRTFVMEGDSGHFIPI